MRLCGETSDSCLCTFWALTPTRVSFVKMFTLFILVTIIHNNYNDKFMFRIGVKMLCSNKFVLLHFYRFLNLDCSESAYSAISYTI